MSEGFFEVNCGELGFYIDKETVISINRFVTETDEVKDDLGSEGFESFISVFDTDELDFSREEDYHQVINEGILGNLFENILYMECRKNSDIIHLTAFIMKTLAESQVFADGNKRTAYISGSAFLMSYQRQNGVESPVVPYLSSDFVSILQDIAIGEESLKFLENYLDSLRGPIMERS
jgi:prophage maintenance system killer protein